MKAVVFHGVGDLRLDNVRDPKIEEPFDAIIRLTASAICGTDLHMVRGTMPGMEPGTILGHEGVGIVEEIGKKVRNLRVGDRVVIPSTIACGCCSYCRSGYYSQCDHANPNGPRTSTAFFGGPKLTGPFQGLQAEYARVPYANIGCVKLPDSVSDDQAILLSDIYPTGYFGAEIAEIEDGDTVAVFGCGPVGLFAILSAFQLGASRVFAVDRIPSRLEMAQALGAEAINFEEADPAEVILEMTDKIGVDRVIDAVGVDAEPARSGPAKESKQERQQHEETLKKVAPETNPDGVYWVPGQAPTQVLEWVPKCIAKAGTLSIVGVYPETMTSFPLGKVMGMNLTINMGNCPHRKYIPHLVAMTASGEVNPEAVLTQHEPVMDALEAYRAFDLRQPGWIKVELMPQAAAINSGR